MTRRSGVPRTLMHSVCHNELENLLCKQNGDSVNQNIRATQTIKEIFEWEILNMVFSGDIFRGFEDYLNNKKGMHPPKYKFHKMGGKTLDFDPENFVVDDIEAEDVYYFVYDWRADNSLRPDGQGSANRLGMRTK